MEIRNKKAYYDYFVEKELEAGIELKGTEIKAIRNGSMDIRDAFVIIKNNEAQLLNSYVAKYEAGNQFNHDEHRTRKLLLHKKEILKLNEAANQEGFSLIPLKVYLKRNRVKVLLGICRGKKNYDKRATIKARDLEREIKTSYEKNN
ncbi:MAG TPA: SsrA-binding protein SmpB [Bacilli bacterium]|nr:SsrA-binding protein SmpB [Bacilli bacterium]